MLKLSQSLSSAFMQDIDTHEIVMQSSMLNCICGQKSQIYLFQFGFLLCNSDARTTRLFLPFLIIFILSCLIGVVVEYVELRYFRLSWSDYDVICNIPFIYINYNSTFLMIFLSLWFMIDKITIRDRSQDLNRRRCCFIWYSLFIYVRRENFLR